MTTLRSYRISLLELSDKTALQLIYESRQSRRTPKKAQVVKQVKQPKPKSIKNDLTSFMSFEEKQQLLLLIEGKLK